MQSLSKLSYIGATVVLAALLGAVGFETWRSHDHIRLNGHEAALVVGLQYNASRWAEPLPLKKLHSYTAKLSPNFDAVIETDQQLAPRQQVFIRHLPSGDTSDRGPLSFLRPISGRIRLRAPTDGVPSAVDPTAPLDHAVNLAMNAKTGASAVVSAPDPNRPTVAFLIGGANDSTLELIWNNSRAGEWVLLGLGLFLLQAFALNAWTLPWREFKPCDEDKDFVHPSLETVEPDAPRPAVKRIAYKPRTPAAAPATEASEPPSATEGETKLKLPRK